MIAYKGRAVGLSGYFGNEQYSGQIACIVANAGRWLSPSPCAPTPTPTNTATITPTDTPTSTDTPTATNKPTYTATDTPTFTETPTDTPNDTSTSTATETPTDNPTPTAVPSDTPTETPTNTATDPPAETPTNTPTYTPASTLTVTNTATPPAEVLVGHVTWQGPPAQPSVSQQLPITLNLCVGGAPVAYGPTTDSSGFFTVTTSLSSGSYNWWAKGPKYLATSGMVLLTGGAITQVEMGQQRAGDTDATHNNVVNITDFNVLKGDSGRQAWWET